VSRAFVKEDSDGAAPRYPLPARDDPGYPLAAARALLDGANRGDTQSAEEATGYVWGDVRLAPEIHRIRDEAINRGDDRLETLADRFLKAAGVSIDE
jgi:hypothetical protein